MTKSKAKHIFFSMMYAHQFGVIEHPQVVMRNLGISYQKSTPQSMYDAWQFWNCENLPDELPPYLIIKDWDPSRYIGYGLREDEAKEILAYETPAIT